MNLNRRKMIWSIGLAGLAWNAFGVVQFMQTVRATQESLMNMGMNAAQAQVMTSYPLWMTAAFAVGTFGGLLGCLLLLAKNVYTKQVFLTSLIGYIVLFIGDITEGVFAALGIQQVVILLVVVLIAAGLYNFTRRLEQT